MRDLEKQAVLKSLIYGNCVGNQMFTTTEIANGLKTIGVWMRNRDVAKYMRQNVRCIADSAGVHYAISTIRVSSRGRMINAECYHPATFDPQNYLSRDLTPITPAQFEDMHGYNPIPINERKN